MAIKTVENTNVLYISCDVTIPEIGERSVAACAEIDADAKRRSLDPAGPWIFVSRGRTGDPMQRFQHDYCLPIASFVGGKGGVSRKTLSPFPCATSLIRGSFSVESLTAAYSEAVQLARSTGRKLTGESREVYHSWSGPHANDNLVEIQIGIAP